VALPVSSFAQDSLVGSVVVGPVRIVGSVVVSFPADYVEIAI
jgi:hypothetical protein